MEWSQGVTRDNMLPGPPHKDLLLPLRLHLPEFPGAPKIMLPAGGRFKLPKHGPMGMLPILIVIVNNKQTNTRTKVLNDTSVGPMVLSQGE